MKFKGWILYLIEDVGLLVVQLIGCDFNDSLLDYYYGVNIDVMIFG